MRNIKIRKGILLIIPFLMLIIYLLVNANLNEIVNFLPKCYILEKYGIYCPACGNTRCIASIIKLDILSAIRYNPFTFGVILCSVLCYIEQFSNIFLSKKLTLIPRKSIFWIPLTIILIIFYILRIFFTFLR